MVVDVLAEVAIVSKNGNRVFIYKVLLLLVYKNFVFFFRIKSLFLLEIYIYTRVF